MQTRIMDIVDRLFFFINQLPEEDRSLNIHLIIESKLSLARLVRVLTQYKNMTAEVNAATSEPFKAFLAARWQCIKGTDAIYMHHPDTPINLACFQLAKEMADALHIPVYDFLMPSLKSIEIKTSKGTLADLLLTEFVLGDDGLPIEIIACLDEYRKTSQLNHTTLNSSGQQCSRRLTPAEINRVINHSNEAREYYLAILTSKSDEDLNDCRTKCLISLEGLSHINSSYEKEGDKQLAKYVCAGINKSNELVNILLSYVPKFRWYNFLQDISNNDLFRLVLDLNLKAGEAPDRLQIQKILNNKFFNLTEKLSEGRLSVVDKERRVRAWLLCVVQVYQLGRKNGDDYASSYGYYLSFFPSYTGVYAEDEKLEAANALINVILGDTPLSSIKSLIAVGALSKYAGPLQSGTLGWLTQQIIKLGDYFEKEQLAGREMLEIKKAIK